MTDHRASGDLVYAGFWIRVWASIIDSVLVMIVLFPLASLVPGLSDSSSRSGQFVNQYGQANYNINYNAIGLTLPGPLHILVFWLLPAVAVVLFWIARSATPGKMAIGARIVDARTGGKPSSMQMIGRYLGYFVSMFPFFLGLIWVGIDRRKQGWHDKLAGTVVVRKREAVLATARFEDELPRSRRDVTGWKS